MSNRARRAIAVTSLVAVLATGLGGCKHKGSSAATPSPTPTAALQMLGTGNPFADIRTAAAHMPDTAAALASGIAKANAPTASPVPTPKSAVVSGNPDTAAAGLRAKLTYLLTEHVYLSGIAIATAYHFGADSPQFDAAGSSVANNSSDLADLIGTVPGADKDAFLQAWRQHVTDFVNYAKDAKEGGPAGDAAKKAADNDLLAYAKAEGEFFSKLTHDALSAGAVQQAFTTHISSFATAIDAMAAGHTDEFKLLKTAAGHMTDGAAALAAGIAKSAGIAGDPASKASTLRSELTGLLTAHVYLAGIAVFTAYSTTGATSSPAYQGAADALDTNSQDLAAEIGTVAGPDNQKKFLSTWRSHIDDFIAYAKADATDDAAGKTTASNNLLAYTGAAGSFFSDISGGALNASTVAAALKDHVISLEGAIDSLKTAVADVPATTPPSFGPTTSPSASGTPSASPSASPSPSPTVSATANAKANPSASPTPTAGPTSTAGPTPTAKSKAKKKKATASASPKATSDRRDDDSNDRPDDPPDDDRGEGPGGLLP
ncbi:MAG TPA: hypothetical protein VHV82_04435 [Sporichthyaceae bacterium]|jgi:hypothetical protein|nr:hypothetical protein [Sporichthyaceae bacterium]